MCGGEGDGCGDSGGGSGRSRLVQNFRLSKGLVHPNTVTKGP